MIHILSWQVKCNVRDCLHFITRSVTSLISDSVSATGQFDVEQSIGALPRAADLCNCDCSILPPQGECTADIHSVTEWLYQANAACTRMCMHHQHIVTTRKRDTCALSNHHQNDTNGNRKHHYSKHKGCVALNPCLISSTTAMLAAATAYEMLSSSIS
jgi:hypothetical protein